MPVASQWNGSPQPLLLMMVSGGLRDVPSGLTEDSHIRGEEE